MRKITILLTLLMTGLSAWAEPVTRDEAKMKAREFMASKGVLMATDKAAYRSPRKVAGKADSEKAYYYVFNAGNDNGYVIISGDDRTETVLGYADKGSFDIDRMPEHMLSFLQGYADQIQYLDDTNATSDKYKVKKKNKPVLRAIPSLLKSKWNQGDPYNRLVPEYWQGNNERGRCATGCVATAMAQVINFWKYPANIRANIPAHSVTFKTDDGVEHVESMPTVRRGTAIDWEHMCDTYSSANSEEECTAVAQLMMMVGQSLKMGYGPSSGASTGYAPVPFKNIFGFDKSCYAASRPKYTIDQWTNLIYGEIAQGRPVMFGGHSTGGGHSFVLDGYDGEGLFHVNWGWGGSCNGYFRVVILNPGDNSGIGASSSSDGYSMSQTAIINAIPPQEGSKAAYTDMSVIYPSLTADGAGTPAIKCEFVNWTGTAGRFQTGIGFLNEDGTFTPIGNTNTEQYNANAYRWYTYPIIGLAPGTYKVSPISRQEKREDWAASFNTDMEWIEVNVDADRKATATWIRPLDGLSVANITFTGNGKAGSQQTLDVTFNNENTEYYGEIHCFASLTSDKGSSKSHSALSVRKGEQETISLFFATNAEETGNYHVWICSDGEGTNVLGETTVEITTNGTSAEVQNHLSLVSNTINNNVSGNIISDQISGTVVLKNNDTEDYEGIVTIQLWIKEVNSGTYWTNGNVRLYCQIPAGGKETYDYLFKGKELNRTFGISINNDKATVNSRLWGIGRIGDTKPGILRYMANGKITGALPAAVMRTPSGVAAVDLRGNPTIKTVRDGGYPNTVYYVDKDADIAGLEGLNVVRDGHADEINIYDGSAFYIPMSIQADKVVYHRTFAKGSTGKNNWGVLMLPFKPESITCEGEELNWKEQEGLLVRQFDHLTDDNIVSFEYAEEIDANIPYVVAAPLYNEGKEILMTAENVTLDANTDSKPKLVSEAYNFLGQWNECKMANVYVINADGTAFELATKAAQIKGMDAYFVSKLPEGTEADKIIICDQELGISDLTQKEAAKAKMFDLQGRRINGKPAKGTYIVDGRKVIVK